ncbi:cation transport ATPase nitrogen fixation protein FixI (plasmid) [Rhizobium etli bv. mimosae str. IE4771]|uniref:Cation transport ATPase nitrogen fixation protein FixI n=1 Tax=Rhizobium etli bv. mimosae str. IE4771 TaxID=1432050 RepID=A0A060I404_RHIET|nr:cation-translocating P-type ATPase [Rhizobium sp. IE4771]AIC29878.1 cation transport ATPase nitrogen fixation protein FixI [Rhizobium sp. IE4771]
MTCCTIDAEGVMAMDHSVRAEEIANATHPLGDGLRQLDLSVPDLRCSLCISTIERALRKLPYVTCARVNLTARRVSCTYVERLGDVSVDPTGILSAIEGTGHRVYVFTPTSVLDRSDVQRDQLLIAVAVSGFAAANIMLLSISVWSGAEAATRDMFHWLSAMIAAPALVYAGRPFFQSAWNSLKHGRTNMDVPISLAVILSYALSLLEVVHHGEHTWFDASVSLLFFLLIGRTLDHIMREKARAAVNSLAILVPRGALVIAADGSKRYTVLEDIGIGDNVFIAAGERCPVDGVVTAGTSELDFSIVSGESIPVAVAEGAEVRSGAMNLIASLTVRATKRVENSLLAEIIKLMEAAEGGRARYRRIADRVAGLYAPAVHLLALISFLAWGFVGGDWKHAMFVAVSVLIITCPCALGLAVPVVQVVAAGNVFRRGIIIKDGSALERLAEVDTVVFDKTGTLTLGQPSLLEVMDAGPEEWAIAAGLAEHSRHPLAQALLRSAGSKARRFDSVIEIPGAGLQVNTADGVYRLGRPIFACSSPPHEKRTNGSSSEVVLSRDGIILSSFYFDDTLRPGAAGAIRELNRAGLQTIMLSGDRQGVVEATARVLHMDRSIAELNPKQKVEECARLSKAGSKVMMVGDGINDAPALAAAHVSMAPATASDIGRQAADLVFLSDGLDAVPEAVLIARRSATLIRQNFALAFGYNLLAVPLAMAGYATPLIAAVAMSMSSLIVVTNALRLNGWRRPRK